MNETSINCPICKHEFKITDQLAAPLVEAVKIDFLKQLAAKDALILESRVKIAEEESKKAKKAVAFDLETKEKEVQDLNEILQQKEGKLIEAQNAQTEYLKKQRLIEDEKREMDLTIEKRVQASSTAIREAAKKEIEDELNLKVAEKELLINQMGAKIEELKRKSEQGSSQIQGEVQELFIEKILKDKFTDDLFEPISKGIQGGDCIQIISNSCGLIQWESKRTILWNDKWLEKAREDQRNANADVAVIVSKTLPKRMDNKSFDLIDGVWVASPQYVIPIAVLLRHCLVEVNAVRKAGEGQKTKMDMMYDYLIGSGFRNRIEALVEKLSGMMEDLLKERKAIKKVWSKREKDIRISIDSAAGMYGDLQGILGKALCEIASLDIVTAFEIEDESGRFSPEE